MGLNEVRVGLPVARNVLFALEQVVGNKVASRLTTTGQLVSPDEALALGMVDEVVAPGLAVDHCLVWARGLLEMPPTAMNKTRLAARSELIDRNAEITAYARLATDAWFGDETRRMMRDLVASLKS